MMLLLLLLFTLTLIPRFPNDFFSWFSSFFACFFLLFLRVLALLQVTLPFCPPCLFFEFPSFGSVLSFFTRPPYHLCPLLTGFIPLVVSAFFL